LIPAVKLYLHLLDSMILRSRLDVPGRFDVSHFLYSTNPPTLSHLLERFRRIPKSGLQSTKRPVFRRRRSFHRKSRLYLELTKEAVQALFDSTSLSIGRQSTRPRFSNSMKRRSQMNPRQTRWKESRVALLVAVNAVNLAILFPASSHSPRSYLSLSLVDHRPRLKPSRHLLLLAQSFSEDRKFRSREKKTKTFTRALSTARRFDQS